MRIYVENLEENGFTELLAFLSEAAEKSAHVLTTDAATADLILLCGSWTMDPFLLTDWVSLCFCLDARDLLTFGK
jgi:hypothetical protein